MSQQKPIQEELFPFLARPKKTRARRQKRGSRRKPEIKPVDQYEADPDHCRDRFTEYNLLIRFKTTPNSAGVPCEICKQVDEISCFTPEDQGPFCMDCFESLCDPDQALLLEERLAKYEFKGSSLC